MLINGQQSELISANDRGLQYGDGLFETIAVQNGQLCLWERHIERLSRGCARLGIPVPDPKQLFSEAVKEIAHNEHCVLKIIITRGAGGRGYRSSPEVRPTRIIYSSPWPDYPENVLETGVSIRICSTRLGCNPALAQIKHLNRLEQVLARSEWSVPAIAEGIMLDLDGRVIEGTMSNLFLVKDGCISTPNLEHCGTAGIMRALIIELASSLDISVEEVDIGLEDLSDADALFLSNSLIGVWPVKGLEGRVYRMDAIPSLLIKDVMAQGFSS